MSDLEVSDVADNTGVHASQHGIQGYSLLCVFLGYKLYLLVPQVSTEYDRTVRFIYGTNDTAIGYTKQTQ